MPPKQPVDLRTGKLVPRLLQHAALPALAGVLMAADANPAATAHAAVTVLEPVTVNAWLGVPVGVYDLLLARDGPAGPATGDLVTHVPETGAPPPLARLPAALVDSIVASRTPFSVDFAQDAALLARGPAAAISAAVDSDGSSPLVITVAFN
jgi:hypothetical protein